MRFKHLKFDTFTVGEHTTRRFVCVIKLLLDINHGYKTGRILKKVCFDVLGRREEERRASREKRKQHAEGVTEEDFTNGKRHQEGKEFANSPNFAFRFHVILFYL